MPERSAEQKASADLAATVFADPELHGEFDAMMKATDEREPIVDDFGRLAPLRVPCDRCDRLMRYIRDQHVREGSLIAELAHILGERSA